MLNVDFNSLDINFNLQTWVVILDFFGIGSGGPVEDEVAVEPELKNLQEQGTVLSLYTGCPRRNDPFHKVTYYTGSAR